MAETVTETYGLLTAPILAMSDRRRATLERTLRAAQEETLACLNQTLERNARALESFRECRGLPGLMAAEQEWISGVMRDSIEQTQRMAKLWWRLAEEELQSRVEAAEEAMPKTNGKTEGRSKPAQARAAA